jgi:hypothetical protein
VVHRVALSILPYRLSFLLINPAVWFSLLLQAEFLAGQSGAQPAARATRVTRKPTQQQQQQQQHQEQPKALGSTFLPQLVGKAAQQQEEATETDSKSAASSAADQQQDEQLCPTIPGILSDVKERMHTSAQAQGPPAAAAAATAAGAGAFPKAVHRKQSKVRLQHLLHGSNVFTWFQFHNTPTAHTIKACHAST